MGVTPLWDFAVGKGLFGQPTSLLDSALIRAQNNILDSIQLQTSPSLESFSFKTTSALFSSSFVLYFFISYPIAVVRNISQVDTSVTSYASLLYELRRKKSFGVLFSGSLDAILFQIAMATTDTAIREIASSWLEKDEQNIQPITTLGTEKLFILKSIKWICFYPIHFFLKRSYLLRLSARDPESEKYMDWLSNWQSFSLFKPNLLTIQQGVYSITASIIPGYIYYCISDLLNYCVFEYLSSKLPITSSTNESSTPPTQNMSSLNTSFPLTTSPSSIAQSPPFPVGIPPNFPSPSSPPPSSLSASKMFFRLLALGLCSQVATKLLIYPFETILSQWWWHSRTLACSDTVSFLSCLKQLVKVEGLIGLYRGFEETVIWEIGVGLIVLEGSWYASHLMNLIITLLKRE